MLADELSCKPLFTGSSQSVTTINHHLIFNEEVIQNLLHVEGALVKRSRLRRRFSPDAPNVYFFSDGDQVVDNTACSSFLEQGKRYYPPQFRTECQTHRESRAWL